MRFLCFEDDELDILLDVINHLQVCFHPDYASDGRFCPNAITELNIAKNNIYIIADKNLVSPICEIAVKGKLNDKIRMQKVACFVTWSMYLNARLTCGIGLLENDSSKLCTASGEESRLQFLHGVDMVPAMMWKELAFGRRNSLPDEYLYRGRKTVSNDYDFSENLLYLCNEVSVLKIVQLIRQSHMKPIDKFLSFMQWYVDNLDITESVVMYAALVFSNQPNVSLPKKATSSDYTAIMRGIKNQAWDLTYITAWSMQMYNASKDECWMFATDDITQKKIVVNTFPAGECSKAISVAFHTKDESRRLAEFNSKSLGQARKRPFKDLSNEARVIKVKSLLSVEYEKLKTMI